MRSSQNFILRGNDSTCQWKLLMGNWMLYSRFKNVFFLFFPSSYFRMTVKKPKGLFINPVTIINQHSSVHLDSPHVPSSSGLVLFTLKFVPYCCYGNQLYKTMDSIMTLSSLCSITLGFYPPPIALPYPTLSSPDLLSPPSTFMPLFFQDQIPHMMDN